MRSHALAPRQSRGSTNGWGHASPERRARCAEPSSDTLIAELARRKGRPGPRRLAALAASPSWTLRTRGNAVADATPIHNGATASLAYGASHWERLRAAPIAAVAAD